MSKKPVSCGVIITDGKVILLGHSTGNEHWDIPKGKMDKGETYIQTALRELQEETSIVLSADDVVEIGVLSYTPRKDLYLCCYKTDDLPDINDVVCTSFCMHGDKEVPELDRFKYVAFKKIGNYTTPNMLHTLENILTYLDSVV